MVFNDELNGGDSMATVIVDGRERSVERSANTRATLKNLIQEQGISTYSILVNGKEVTSAADLPETIGENQITVMKYDKNAA